MAEYIEREAFIEDILTEITNLRMNGLKGTPRPYEKLYGFIDRINDQPVANVAPVVHARYNSEHCCTNCGETALETPCPGTYYHTLHCWACNAKMDNGFGIGDAND